MDIVCDVKSDDVAEFSGIILIGISRDNMFRQ